MRDRFHEFIELRPVASIWLLLWSLVVAAFTGSMILLSDASTPLTTASLLGLLLCMSVDCQRIAGQPELIRCAPDGRWSGLWPAPGIARKPFSLKLSGGCSWAREPTCQSGLAKTAGTAKNLTVERHFLLGTRSITLLVRDDQGRLFRFWCFKNACPDPQWRRLRVLLRWPDATKGQGKH